MTEYELPHVLLAAHDVSGDSKGNIWYSSHRTPFMGKLDPRTGIVTEYQVPPTPPGVPARHPPHPGGHERHRLGVGELGAQRGAVRSCERRPSLKIPLIAGQEPLNTPGVGNFSIGPDGGDLVRAQQGGPEVRFEDRQAPGARSLHHQSQRQPLRQHHHRRRQRYWAGGSAARRRRHHRDDGHAHQQAPGGAQLLAGLDGRRGRLRRGRQSLVRRPRRRAAGARRQGARRSANSGRRPPM